MSPNVLRSPYFIKKINIFVFEAHTNKQIMDEEKVAAGVVKVQEDSGIHSMEIFK